MQENKKVLMMTIVNSKSQPLLKYWFPHFEYERNTKKVDLEALILMRNMNEEEVVKMADNGDEIVHFLNVGNVDERKGWEIGFEYARQKLFPLLYLVKINAHPNDGTLSELLPFCNRDNVGCVSAQCHIKKGGSVHIGGKVFKSNTIGIGQAGDEKKKVVWMDCLPFNTLLLKTLLTAKISIYPADGGKQMRNFEYDFTNRVKKGGWNVVLAKDSISLWLEQEGKKKVGVY